jgi:hypothetical protein
VSKARVRENEKKTTATTDAEAPQIPKRKRQTTTTTSSEEEESGLCEKCRKGESEGPVLTLSGYSVTVVMGGGIDYVLV